MIEYVGTATFLFVLGLYCLGTKRNLIKNMIGMVILFAGVNLNFIYFSFKGPTVNLLGQAIVTTVIVLEGCVLAVALAYVYAAFRETKSLNLRKLRSKSV